jgi:hypothetical protein
MPNQKSMAISIVGVLFLFFGLAIIGGVYTIPGLSLVGPGGCSAGGVLNLTPAATSIGPGQSLQISGRIGGNCDMQGTVVDIWGSFVNGFPGAGSSSFTTTVTPGNVYSLTITTPNVGGNWYLSSAIAGAYNSAGVCNSMRILHECGIGTTTVLVTGSAPSTFTVQFQYSSYQGTYESGVISTVSNSAGNTIATTSSNSNGIASFSLPAGSYSLLSVPDGSLLETSLTTSFTISGASATTIQIQLIQAAITYSYSYQVTVLTNSTGQWLGVPNIYFTLYSGSQIVFTGTTGASGSVTISGLAVGSYTLVGSGAQSGTATITVSANKANQGNTWYITVFTPLVTTTETNNQGNPTTIVTTNSQGVSVTITSYSSPPPPSGSLSQARIESIFIGFVFSLVGILMIGYRRKIGM